MSPKKPRPTHDSPAEPAAPAPSTKTSRSSILDPVYALVGATNLTAEALRELGSKTGPRTTDEEPEARTLARLRHDVVDIARGTTRVPALAASEVFSRYAELAQRGQQAVADAVPTMRRASKEGEALARAEDARARREARRLARQAGATVDRGRAMAADAATDATRAAGRTFETVRSEGTKVVEAVQHAGRTGRAGRRPGAGRRAAVVDTTVTATSPAGGEAEATTTRHERTSAAGVEAAAATTTARRSPRARKAAAAAAAKAAEGAGRPTGTHTAEPAGATVKQASAKKASAKKTSAKKAAATKSPRKVAPARSGADAPAEKTAKKTAAVKAAPAAEPHAHVDIPTPGDVAAVVESNDDAKS
ncbi:hypothetical protein [Mobilicoccus massiliensis]|uniref:hypothetical protein n=1 Tax=Mobilicoccus massiliensis TaxID=1522310 RepID=UPI000694E0DB|nr:hypothetical protein [Mobilicoccus massiliensis]